MQQTNNENIVKKAEIAHDEQFLHLLQYVQIYLLIVLSFIEKSHPFAKMFSETLNKKSAYAVQQDYTDLVKTAWR